MHSRFYGGKMYNNLLFTMDRVIGFLFFTEDVASTMCCSWFRKFPFPALPFIGSDPLYKWRTAHGNLPRRGRFWKVFASSSHGPRLPFSLNMFFEWTNTLAAFTIPVLTIQPSWQLHSICMADWPNVHSGLGGVPHTRCCPPCLGSSF